ncbi:MAG: hypothetical protein V2A77_02330 [Pseudomonadota bacterium]
MLSKVAGMSPADASMRLVEWLMYYQNKAEEKLSQELAISNIKEEISSGFIANRSLGPTDRKRVEILIRLMALGHQALEVPIGKDSNSAQTLEGLVNEAQRLYEEFEKA